MSGGLTLSPQIARHDAISVQMEQLDTRRIEVFSGNDTRDRVGTPGDGLAAACTDSAAVDTVVELVHDLRSPLTSIMVIAERLLRAEFGDVSDVQRRQLGVMYAAALGLHALTSDVMDYANGGGRSLDLESGPFSVREVIESVAGMVEPLAIEKGVALRTSLPSRELRWGPRSALGRVLLNLATNALKFTHEGYVEIAAHPSENGRVPFYVRDSGPGMPPDALQTLLLPLGPPRAPSEYPASERGLGLRMCRRLLHAMRSELRIETRPGWGTRFDFEVDLPSPGSSSGSAVHRGGGD
jgi:signal transduction histidine kinase